MLELNISASSIGKSSVGSSIESLLYTEDSPLSTGSWQCVLGGDLSLAGNLGGTQQ